MANYIENKVRRSLKGLNEVGLYSRDKTFEKDLLRVKKNLTDLMLFLCEAKFQSPRYPNFCSIEKELVHIFDKTCLPHMDTDMLKIICSEAIDLFDAVTITQFGCFSVFLPYWHLYPKETGGFLEYLSKTREYNILFYDVPHSIVDTKLTKAEKLNTYQVILDDNKKAGKLIENLAFGVGPNSRISNRVFDILMIAPNCSIYYDVISTKLSVIPDHDRNYIQNTLIYLRAGGLACITLPYFRLDYTISSYLAKNLTNIYIRKVSDIMIEIYGTKSDDNVLDVKTYYFLRNFFKTFSGYKTPKKPIYQLPDDLLPVSLFKGSRITEDMVAMAKAHSNCFKDIEKQCIHNENFGSHTPLLPFNTHQIGLVLASGCADGLIEEENGGAHLIKGRVMCHKTSEEIGNTIQIVSYHTVEIHALTPSGAIFKIM